jgi:hypothetical protein
LPVAVEQDTRYPVVAAQVDCFTHQVHLYHLKITQSQSVQAALVEVVDLVMELKVAIAQSPHQDLQH